MKDRMVDEKLLLEFFKQATEAMENLDQLDHPVVNLGDLRQVLLATQTSCLQSAVAKFPNSGWTTAGLQQVLKSCAGGGKDYSVSVQRAVEEMDEAARLAFCRLVLYSEYIKDLNNQSRKFLSSSNFSKMKESDVFEFCGLCLAALGLPFVVEHVQCGTRLFDNVPASSCAGETIHALPRVRMQLIQRMFLRALGYQPDHGVHELKRIMDLETPIDGETDLSGNQMIQDTVRSTMQKMETLLLGCDHQLSDYTPARRLDDNDVTRVVSVSYSEKIIDAVTGEEILTLSNDSAPCSQTMAQDTIEFPAESETRQLKSHDEFRGAHEAAQLQNDILSDLESMSDAARSTKLELARETVDQVLQMTCSIPKMSERIAFMRSLDPEQQRLMAMHKIWTAGLVDNNGGE
jgi:hypothetical protein